MIDLTPIINVLILVVATLVSVYFVPWIKSKKTVEQTKDLMAWARIAVKAAQQLYYQLDGEVRLEHALSVMREAGFNVDTIEVRNAIEAAVLELHNALEGTE
jgi:uncharacterized membrane protein (DUF2068 family)